MLIHAFPVNARMFEPQLELSASGWRVIAPQLRGMDGGDHDPEASSIDDYAGDVIDLLDALHIKNAVIGGVSLGGYVTFGIFRHAPDYFRGMVLADTRPQADTPEGVEGRKRMLALLRSRGVEAIAGDIVPKLLGETTKAERPQVVERTKALIQANSERAVAGAITALMTRPDSSPLLSSIRVPTLIVVGEEDALTPPDLSRGMQQAIAGSELVVIPNAGHLASLETPAAFNAALSTFLRQKV